MGKFTPKKKREKSLKNGKGCLAKKRIKTKNEHYNYIKLDSLESAHKVRESIFDIAESLASNPERFPINRYKQSNKGDIRAFEKFKLRVAY